MSLKIVANENEPKLKADFFSQDLLKHPTFSFVHFSEGNYGLKDCNKEDFKNLIKKLKLLGSITWKEIESLPRHGLGYEKIKVSELKTALPSSVPKSIDKVYVFRYKGKAPMVGYREGNIFHVVFLDHNFSLYKHN